MLYLKYLFLFLVAAAVGFVPSRSPVLVDDVFAKSENPSFSLIFPDGALLGPGRVSEFVVRDAFASLGFPDPCPDADEGEFDWWGRSSPNDEWLVLGIRQVGGIRRAMLPHRCPETQDVLLLCGSGRTVRLPAGAYEAAVSDNGTVALIDDSGVTMYDAQGVRTGRIEESWLHLRCGRAESGGFSPETDLLVRFGQKRCPGSSCGLVRCSDARGEVLWEYETSETIRKVVQAADRSLGICMDSFSVRLTLEGAPTDTFGVGCK